MKCYENDSISVKMTMHCTAVLIFAAAAVSMPMVVVSAVVRSMMSKLVEPAYQGKWTDSKTWPKSAYRSHWEAVNFLSFDATFQS